MLVEADDQLDFMNTKNPDFVDAYYDTRRFWQAARLSSCQVDLCFRLGECVLWFIFI